MALECRCDYEDLSNEEIFDAYNEFYKDFCKVLGIEMYNDRYSPNSFHYISQIQERLVEYLKIIENDEKKVECVRKASIYHSLSDLHFAFNNLKNNRWKHPDVKLFDFLHKFHCEGKTRDIWIRQEYLRFKDESDAVYWVYNEEDSSYINPKKITFDQFSTIVETMEPENWDLILCGKAKVPKAQKNLKLSKEKLIEFFEYLSKLETFSLRIFFPRIKKIISEKLIYQLGLILNNRSILNLVWDAEKNKTMNFFPLIRKDKILPKYLQKLETFEKVMVKNCHLAPESTYYSPMFIEIVFHYYVYDSEKYVYMLSTIGDSVVSEFAGKQLVGKYNPRDKNTEKYRDSRMIFSYFEKEKMVLCFGTKFEIIRNVENFVEWCQSKI